MRCLPDHSMLSHSWYDDCPGRTLGRLEGSGLKPIQHSGPLFQMTWHVPYHYGRLMSAIHTPCSHCDTTDSMRQEHTYGNHRTIGGAHENWFECLFPSSCLLLQ